MMQVFNSFTEHIKEKSKSPFFGTLICVWLVRNWELIYTLFNFDKDCNLADKIQFVRDYYAPKSFWNELLTNVGIAFGLMLIGFFLLIITKVIANIVDQRIIPSLNDKTVKGLTVKRTLYEQVKKHGLDLQDNLDIVSKKLLDIEVSNSQLKTEKTNLELSIIELDSNLKRAKSELEKLEKNNDLLNSIRLSQQSELRKNTLTIAELTDKEILHEYLKRDKKARNIGLPKIITSYRKLYRESLKEGFLNLANCITSDSLSTSIEKGDFKTFTEMHLISLKNTDYKIDYAVSSKELNLEPLGYSIFKNIEILKDTI